MIVHPLSNRAFWLSMVSIGLLFLSIASFILFTRIQNPNFLLALVCFFVISLSTSIVSIVFASKAKKQIRFNPSGYTAKGRGAAAIVISIVSLVLNILFILLAAFLLYLAATLFK